MVASVGVSGCSALPNIARRTAMKTARPQWSTLTSTEDYGREAAMRGEMDGRQQLLEQGSRPFASRTRISTLSGVTMKARDVAKPMTHEILWIGSDFTIS